MKIQYEQLQIIGQHYIDEAGLQDLIAKCAYAKAEKRGFEDGYQLQDWLEAEEEVGQRCFYWLQE